MSQQVACIFHDSVRREDTERGLGGGESDYGFKIEARLKSHNAMGLALWDDRRCL